MWLGRLVVVESDLGCAARAYPQPVAAGGSFEIPNGDLGLVLEVGNTATGTYFGEGRVLFDDGRVGWIPLVYLRLVDL